MRCQHHKQQVNPLYHNTRPQKAIVLNAKNFSICCQQSDQIVWLQKESGTCKRGLYEVSMTNGMQTLQSDAITYS